MESLLTEYLVNSIWQIPLLAAGAWLLLRTLRPSPRAQHWIWTAVLPLALALPLLSLRTGVAPQESPTSPPSPGAPTADTYTPIVHFPIQQARTPRSSQPHPDLGAGLADEKQLDPPELQPSVSPLPAPTAKFRLPPMREFRLSPSATYWIAAFYLATMAFALIRLLSAWWIARGVIARAAHAVLNPSQSLLLDQCCVRLGVARPNVIESPCAHSPMVVGFVRPSLLLPLGFALRDTADHPRELEAVWLHELAHLRRRDSLAHLACRLLALPMAYHPVTWAVEQRIRQTREMLCDALAAAEMHSSTGYARCLVTLARNLQITNGMPARLDGAALLNGNSLEERVMQLVETRGTVNPRTRTMRLACAAAVILAVTAAAATFHVKPILAQTPVVAAPTAVSPPALPATVAQSAQSPSPDAGSSRQSQEDARRQFEEGIRIVGDSIARANDRTTRAKDGAEQTVAASRREDFFFQSEASRREWQDALQRSIDASFRQKMDLQMLANNAGMQTAEIQKQIAAAKARFDSPEFKAKMKQFDSPEFKKQLEEAKAKFDSPEFKAKIKELNSSEFRKSMELQNQIEIGHAFLNLPQFRKQMEELQTTLNNPEFRKNIEKLDSAELRQQLSSIRKQLDQLREQLRKDRLEPANPLPTLTPAPAVP